MKRAVGGLVATALIVAPFASARHMDVDDPRDTRGALDVREIRTFGRERPGWRIITYRRWGAAGIWDRGVFVVRLDTRGDARMDRYIVVTSNGRRLVARLWRVRRNRRNRVVARVRVWQPDRRSLIMFVPIDRLNVGPGRMHFSWWAHTMWSGRRCPRVCIDRIPDDGRVMEPLEPEPSPSPSPTPTPTPSPTESPTPEPSPSP